MRFRLLPVTMFFAALLLTVKAGEMMTGETVFWARVEVPELHAQQADEAAAAEDAEQAADAAAATADEAEAAEPPPEPVPEFTRAEVDVLQDLRARREALDRREAELDMRESTLKAAEHNLESRIAEWKRLKAEVEELIARFETSQDEELDTLAAYYEKMKPKDAARVFDTLDLEYLVDIVSRMKAAKVAEIIGGMDTLNAKALTMELARRRKTGVLADMGQPQQ
jgi:flagellar motility protein MotE (MotC chaperone)